MKNSARILVLLLVALFAAESSHAQCGCDEDRQPLKGNSWRLVQLNGRTIHSKKGSFEMTLLDQLDRMDEFILDKKLYKSYLAGQRWNTVKGFILCNEFEAIYMTDEKQKFRIESIITTRCGCHDLELEREFLQMLKSVTNYDMDGEMLILLSKGRIRALFESLPQSR